MNEIIQLDRELLEGYLNNLGADIVQQMLDLYIQQSVNYLEDIDKALKQGSQSMWHEHCHKMKGAAGSVGLVAVHKKLVEIEKLAESWDLKLSHLASLHELNESGVVNFKHWLVNK